MVSGCRRRHNWRAHSKIKGYGVPGERGDEWEVPDGEKGLHASGHAGGPDLLKIVHEIKPAVLISVHSGPPGFYVEHLKDSGINVILPGRGKTIDL